MVARHLDLPPMKSPIRFAILAAVAVAACAVPARGPRQAGAIDSLLYLRPGCVSGDCPAYRMTLRRDGTVDWYGSELAVPLGAARDSIGPEAWRRLSRSVFRMGLDTLEDVYPTQYLEADRTELRVFAGTWPARVVVTTGEAGPAPLRALYARFDSIAGSFGWEATPPFRPTVGGLRPY